MLDVFLSYLMHSNDQKYLVCQVVRVLDVFKIIRILFVSNNSEGLSPPTRVPGEHEVHTQLCIISDFFCEQFVWESSMLLREALFLYVLHSKIGCPPPSPSHRK